MSTPTPSVATLIRGMPSGSADILRRVMNQQALERAGHVQAVPMTIEGMANADGSLSVCSGTAL